MLTGTDDERHNLIYAGVFPMLKEKANKKQKNKKKQKSYENKKTKNK